MQRIDLPDSSWVELRDPADVLERDRRPYLAVAFAFAQMTDKATEDAYALYIRQRLTKACALIQAWSFDAPVTLDGLGSLPSLTVDYILSATDPIDLPFDFTATGTSSDPKAEPDASPSSDPSLPTPMPQPLVDPPVSTPNT